MKTPGIVNEPLLDRMERAMNVMSRRQQLVAANISNLDTPGYRTEDIDFKSALAQAVGSVGQGAVPLRATDPRHIAALAGGEDPAEARPVAGLAMRNDGNDVNVDREMIGLAETRQRFDTTAAIAHLRIRQLIAAIEDGRS